ncbi:hypothetical protein D3C85_806810 [compost metagenome]
MRALIAVVALSLALYGCHHPAPPHFKPYDFDTPQASCPDNNDRTVDFQHAFIEFDGYGSLMNSGAYKSPLREIRKIKESVLIVIYVHGWRHFAASDDDGDGRRTHHALLAYEYDAVSRTGAIDRCGIATVMDFLRGYWRGNAHA